MRYFIRSVKYLVYFLIIFLLIVSIVYLFSSQKAAGMSFSSLFKEGSFPQLAIFFAIVAAVYPALGFYKKPLYLNGKFSDYRNLIDEEMDIRGFELEKEDDSQVSYRQKGAYARLSRMFEDRVTFFINEEPVKVEGIRKDVLRITTGISYKVRQQESGQEDS